MRLLVGLGNPGSQYSGTRHNIGFEALDAIAARHGIGISQKKFQSLIGRGRIGGIDVMLAKPQTFMNLSGTAVREIFNFFNLNSADLVVIHDDMDIEAGRMKVSASGGPGGHNGIASIIENLKTRDFARIRVGIGRPEPGRGYEGYVLSKFSSEDKEKIEQIMDRLTEAVEVFVSSGVAEVQAQFNRKGLDI